MPSSIPLENSYNSLQDMKSIPCQSTSFMLSRCFRDGRKSESIAPKPVWGHQEKILTYCTLLVPICSSRKGEYDGILVCTPIVNIDKSYICTKADLNQSVDRI